MPRDLSKLFSLVIPENLHRDSAFSSVSQAIAFDDLADFAEERERIRRKVQALQDAAPKVDFSDFANHVFFDSAVSKFTIAKDKILRQYPFDGSSEDRDLFVLSSSLYEQHVLSEWPTYMGYVQLTASSNQAIVASDPSNKLALGSSSLYVSARIKPNDINAYNPIVQVVSQSLSTNNANGYLFLTYGSVVGLVFFSGGAEVQTITAPIPTWLTQSWGTVAAIYDQKAQTASLYLNDTLLVAEPCSPGAIGFASTDLIIGSGTIYDVGSFDGALDEVRIMYTASYLYHHKNYNRPIVSEPFVKAYYKFNEGVTNYSTSDSTVVDYSQNGLHGKIVNYAPQIRQSGSTSSQDAGDPILYDTHPLVDLYVKAKTKEAQLYDQANRSYILRLIPEDLIVEDQNAQGLLVSFALALARYFDDLKIYIDQFDNLRITNYQDKNSTPDVMLPMLKQYFGWKATDHFGDANPLEFFFGEGITASGSLSTALADIRDQFWRRILNSLPYLYKTKGKRTNLPSFFNVLGINPNLINLKEYGHLKATTLQDELLVKEKPTYFLGFGQNGLTGSYVSVPNLRSAGTYANWTIETYAQLPYPSQNLSGSFLSGTIWQLHPNASVSPSVALSWQLSKVGNASGTFTVSDTSGNSLVSAPVKVFTGDLAHIAVQLSGSTVSLHVRHADNGNVLLRYSTSGTLGDVSAYQAGNLSLRIGSATGSYFPNRSAGYLNQVRYWQTNLSSQELDAHAINLENVGLQTPSTLASALQGHWGLNSNAMTDPSGQLVMPDLSQHLRTATAYRFSALSNPFQNFILPYASLSPALDLKWTENKIRIRNASEITVQDVAVDTNQVALEFNLVDSLDQDIVKIFTTLDGFNNAIGAPINKYRDEYADLEALRAVYFERLSDSIKFTSFFKLFRWFDRKLATSIKQLLPARVDFIGGEFVVQSHMLERNKYRYIYPIFHTPKDVGVGEVDRLGTNTSGSAIQKFIDAGTATGTSVRTQHEKTRSFRLAVAPRPTSVAVSAELADRFVARSIEGHERVNRGGVKPIKVFGDSKDTQLFAIDSANQKNGHARKLYDRALELNVSGTFIDPTLGNGFCSRPINTTHDELHEHGINKTIKIAIRGLSGSNPGNLSASYFTLSNGASIELSQSLWDLNNVAIDTGSFAPFVFDAPVGVAETKFDSHVTFLVSGVGHAFNAEDLQIAFKDNASAFFSSYRDLKTMGSFLKEPDTSVNVGWYRFHSHLFASGAYQRPSVAFGANATRFSASCAVSKTYAFKDVMMTFSQKLSNAGTKFYGDIDNQNNKNNFGNVTRNVFGRVDAADRAAVSFNWKHMPNTPYTLFSGDFNGVPGSGLSEWFNAATVSAADRKLRFRPMNYTEQVGTHFRDYPSYQSLDSGQTYSVGSNEWTSYSAKDQALYKASGSALVRSVDAGGSYSAVANVPSFGFTGEIAIDSNGNVIAKAGDGHFHISDFHGLSGTFVEFTPGSDAFALLTVNQLSSQAYWRFGTILFTATPPWIGNDINTGVYFNFNQNYLDGSIISIKTSFQTQDTYVLALSDDYDSPTFNLYRATGNGAPLLINSFALAGGEAGNRYGSMAVDTYDNIFLVLRTTSNDEFSLGGQTLVSQDGGANFSSIPFLTNSSGTTLHYDAYVDADANGHAYFFYASYDDPTVRVLRTTYMPNYANISSRFLAPSVRYAAPNQDPVTTFTPAEKNVLGNISEFPHYGGVFQCKNIVLGTQSVGTIGKQPSSLVQIRLLGSFVSVLWPDQAGDTVLMSAGGSPGKLGTAYTYGASVETAGYDHLALYCYAKKTMSGSKDDIILKIERRPLPGVDFAVDQAVEYGVVGDDVEARYRDQLHVRSIDYGDLTIKEPSFVFDVPLVNVKQVRVAARFRNGQAFPNCQFIVYGRLIKTTEET